MLIYINDNTAEDILDLLRELEGKITEQIEGKRINERYFGTKVRQRWTGGHVAAGQNRYKMVPRVHISKSRSAFYQGTAQVWWEQELSSIPKHGRDIQKGGI